MSNRIYVAAEHVDRGGHFRLRRRREGQFAWDPVLAPEQPCSAIRDSAGRTRRKKRNMSLVNYGTSSEDDYTSSDNDHLFMATSPRRSSGTASPPQERRLMSRSTPLCVCRNPCAATSVASSAAAYSPVEPAIWNELRRLFNYKNPDKQFDILNRSTPAQDEEGNGFFFVEARVQAKDGSMVAKGEPCTDEVLALRSLRNALIETKEAKSLPWEIGDEIIAGRIEAFEEKCSACDLPRY